MIIAVDFDGTISQMAEGVQPEKANLVKLSVAEAVRFKRRLADQTFFKMTYHRTAK